MAWKASNSTKPQARFARPAIPTLVTRLLTLYKHYEHHTLRAIQVQHPNTSLLFGLFPTDAQLLACTRGSHPKASSADINKGNFPISAGTV